MNYLLRLNTFIFYTTNFGILGDEDVRPKKRGRPPKKAILEDLEALEAGMMAAPPTSPPVKKRILETQGLEVEPNESKFEGLANDDKLKRGRGRPPKKAIIAEIEAEMAKREAEAAKVRTPDILEAPKISDNLKNLDAVEPKFSKKRGRPKKEANEGQYTSDDLVETDEVEPAVKRRALRERKPMSLAEGNDEDFEITNDIMVQRPESSNSGQPEKSGTAAKSKSSEKIEKSETSEKCENLEKSGTSENSEKPCKSPIIEGMKSPSSNSDRYIVQHGVNPLKIKLKTGFQEDLKPSEPQPIKIKFSLKDNESEINHVKKPKKHKKKKSEKSDKSEKSEKSGKSEKIILRIKSPSNRNEDNGFVSGLQEKLVSMASMASPETSATTINEQVTFSPESTPEHQTQATSFILASKDSNQIGLGEGQFNDLMKAIDSDDENTKPWMSSASAAATVTSGESSSSVKQSQLDGSIDTLSRSSSIDSPIHESDHESMEKSELKPKTKSCLIKHVFSAVAKKRKIVVVKYRKPQTRIFDLEEYQRRCQENRLDEAYNEDTDDPTLFKPKKAKIRDSIDSNLDDLFIDQLDGDNDLILDDIEASTSTMGSTASKAPSSATTSTLYILKSQGAKVYQCSQCPEVFPGQKALLTHQSLVHHDSLTIYPCQQCSIGFKDAKSLEIHMRNEHGKQQIVTIIQADLPNTGTGRDTGSVGSSFGSGSSSCSSSTTGSSVASSGYLSGAGGLLDNGIMGNDCGVSGSGLGSSVGHPLLMKQDPVLMFNSDEEQDLMLDESLNLFETSSLIDSGDSAIHLSLDDLANFAQPMVGTTDGSHTRFVYYFDFI